MVNSQATTGCCDRGLRWISGVRKLRTGWRDETSADDEELLANIDTSPSNYPITAIRLCTPRADIRFPDDRPVAGKPVFEPEGPALLPELKVCLRHRLTRVEHANEVVEELAWLRLRIAPDQSGSVHREAFPRAELQHESVSRDSADNAGGLQIGGIAVLIRRKE